MDYSDHTPDQLIDALIDTLARWDKYERYYLDTLIPRIVSNGDLRGSAVEDIAKELRNRLSPDELSRLRELVAARLPHPATAPPSELEVGIKCLPDLVAARLPRSQAVAVLEPEPEVRIRYPGMGQYNEALQYPSTCLLDPELKQGQIVTNAFGLPLVMSGNFALTYSVTVGWNRFAVRCFHRRSRALETRYKAIAEELDSLDSPYFLKFFFQPGGVRVGGETFPIVKMKWGEGETLAQFMESRHGRAGNVHKLRNSLRSLAGYLEDQPLAHGDVQPGNLMVSRAGGTVKLIDYDGMYVEALKTVGSTELGHAGFQHPKRTKDCWDGRLDRFSFLILDVALRALEADPSLWDKTQSSGDAIVFTPGDLAEPAQSLIFRELVGRPEVGLDAQRLASVCLGSYDAIPTVSEFLAGSGVPRDAVVVPGAAGGPSAYVPALPVIDATDYERCGSHEGVRVELVGRIVSTKSGKSKYGEPYVFLDFGDWRDDIVHISIWSEGLAALGHEPDESWVGRWVSVTGLVEPPYYSERFEYTHVAVSVFQAGQLHLIEAAEAAFRLGATRNQTVMRRIRELL